MGDSAIRVLLVEDDENYAFILEERFRRNPSPPFEVVHMRDLRAARQYLAKESVDAILLDLTLPDSEGLDTFAALRETASDTPVVVLTALDDERVALGAVQAGAQDYLIKGEVDVSLLVRSLRYAIERNRLQGLVRALSIIDDLTGLLNRRGFLTVAGQQLRVAGRTKRSLLVFFVDVDNMKWINDTFGHRQGDQALIDTADILRETFRESDIVGRLGGDEFTVLAVEAAQSGAEGLLQRLEDNVARLNRERERPCVLSLSVGISSLAAGSPRSIEELVAEADARMYEEKRLKGGRGSADAGDPRP